METKRKVWIWVVGVSLLFFLVSQLIATLFLVMIGGKEGLFSLDPMSLAFVQAISIVCMFGVSGWILRRLFLKEDRSLGRPLNGGMPVLLSVVAVMIVGQLFVGWSAFLNEQIHLPSFLSGVEEWMRQMELAAKELTDRMMVMDGLGDLFWLLLCLGVVPGVFEEYYFRGMIQPLIYQSTGNKHWAVWGTAILFSAIHLQFMGFIPRLLLALFFGYLLVEGAPLWLAMVAHAVNNSLVVLVAYLESRSVISVQTIDSMEQGGPWWVNLLCTTLTAALLIYLFKRLKKSYRKVL